jgi:cell division protein ZapA
LSTGIDTTEVRIFGAAYNIRGSDGSGHVQALADLVDGKMREIARQVRTQDTARIAILAALNLADELSQLQRRQEGERVEVRERVFELVKELDEALAEEPAGTATDAF